MPGVGCTYLEFKRLLREKGLVESTTGYEEECATSWFPPSGAYDAEPMSTIKRVLLQKLRKDYRSEL